jgi:Protein of unknown function (DUF2934)
MEKGNPTIVSKTGKMPASQVSGAGISSSIPPDQRKHMIEEAAYYLAERRGFCGGDPLQDWLEAEAEIERMMSGKRH